MEKIKAIKINDFSIVLSKVNGWGIVRNVPAQAAKKGMMDILFIKTNNGDYQFTIEKDNRKQFEEEIIPALEAFFEYEYQVVIKNDSQEKLKEAFESGKDS